MKKPGLIGKEYILQTLKERQIFGLDIIMLESGDIFYPICSKEEVTANKQSIKIRITEMCDEYFYIDLEPELLLRLSEELAEIAKSVKLLNVSSS